MCGVLDKLAREHDEIFQLHLNNVATLTTLQKLKLAVFDQLKRNDVNVCLLLQLVSLSNRFK